MSRRWYAITVLLSVSVLMLFCHSSLVIALEWQEVAGELMSPACPGRTLLNCTSGQSEQWRELIRQKISQGETQEKILQYFVSMRGEEILAAPPKRGFALTAWLFPAFVILNGAGVIIVLANRWTRKQRAEQSVEVVPQPSAPPSTALSDPYRDRLRKELQDFSA